MKHVSKTILLTFIFALVLITGFGQKRIQLSIDPTNDTLLVVSPGQTGLGNFVNRKVYWEATDARIASFEIVPKYGTGDPFEDRPGRSHSNKVYARVRFGTGDLGDWWYTIKWTNTASAIHYLDPKITVQPIGSPFTGILLMVGLVASLIAAIVFYRNWQNAERRLAEVKRQNRS